LRDLRDDDVLFELAQEGLEHGIDLAQAAERGRDQQAGVRPVARGELPELRLAGEHLVERPPLAQHPVEHIEREPAGADRGRALRGHGRGRRPQAAG